MKTKDIIACLYSKGYTFSQLKELENSLITPSHDGSFFDFCNKNWIKYLVKNEVFLKKTKNPPYVLYYKWNIKLVNKKIIWIVWPRLITNFIKEALEKFFSFLEGKDIVIVSWFANWTDEYAHKLALKYNIPTIAVLGYGFEQLLTKKIKLVDDILQKNGLFLSEFRLDQEWTKWTFPQRNRIIAWLSDFLFVPQAALNSWTLITVNLAVDLKIPVYSCFSSYNDENWLWTNKLIFEKKINWIYDFDKFLNEITDKFSLWNIDFTKWEELTLLEEKILKTIKLGKNSLEEIVLEANLDIADVLNILSNLELKWLIYEELGSYFVK